MNHISSLQGTIWHPLARCLFWILWKSGNSGEGGISFTDFSTYNWKVLKIPKNNT
jgi:hypothetical protein